MASLSGLGYICGAGESFDSVALVMYGNEKYAADLLKANPELDRLLVFHGGETLRLPVVQVTESSSGQLAPAEIAPWKQA